MRSGREMKKKTSSYLDDLFALGHQHVVCWRVLSLLFLRINISLHRAAMIHRG